MDDNREILLQIAAGVKRIEQKLLKRRAISVRNVKADMHLLTLIAMHSGGKLFTTNDMMTLVPEDAQKEVWTAYKRACGAASARRLGHLLLHYKDQTIGGVTVRREGSNKQGNLWALL